MRPTFGVIGHVDHGKTTLVRALTGMETDRLEEERRRGISIALGFAHLRIGGTDIDLIDMPGHERFVRTMVAGATGIGAVLLVVAATEGVMPQTVEHVDIAGLLGVRRAIVVVTKVDRATLAEARATGAAAAELAARAGMLTGEPLLASAVSGDGIPALREAMAAVVGDGEALPDDGFPYLPVDRCFSVAGHGTVVTGTLRRGRLTVADELAVLPSGLPVRLRGLQVHGARVSVAEPGRRLAANIRGVGCVQVPVGTALSARGLMRPSEWLTVEVRAVASAGPLPTTMRLRLLLGTQEIDARLRLLDRDELLPDDIALAQLRCVPPVAVPARERFILRLPSPARTVAGGFVLDPEAVRLRRHAPEVLARLAALAAANPGEVIRLEVAAAGEAGVAIDRLGRLAGLAPFRVVAHLDTSTVGTGGVAVAGAALDALRGRLPRVLSPHPEGLSREALLGAFPDTQAAVLDVAVGQLLETGALRRVGGVMRVARPASGSAQARQQADAVARMAEILRLAGFTPPDPTALAADPQSRRLLAGLVREGVVIRAADRVQKRDLLFHRDAVDAARRRLAPLLASGPGLLVREAGEALGISRKFSVPLLEYLDSIKFTRRIEDRRVLADDDGSIVAAAR